MIFLFGNEIKQLKYFPVIFPTMSNDKRVRKWRL